MSDGKNIKKSVDFENVVVAIMSANESNLSKLYFEALTIKPRNTIWADFL